MKFIKLSQNKETIVDDDIFDYLNQWKWYFKDTGYAVRNSNPKKNLIKMHRLIMNTPIGMATDHINGNRLDNRRSNLRICTIKQNNCNRFKVKNTTSKYKGVYLKKPENAWIAQISVNARQVPLGRFKKERWAAMAYDIWAKDLFGEFANVNFK